MKKKKDTIALLHEAIALEAARSSWSQQHAAAVARMTPGTLRLSDCPHEYEEQNGAKGKPRPVYDPAAVRAWIQSRRRPMERAS